MGHEKSQDGSSRAYTLDLDLLIVIMGREGFKNKAYEFQCNYMSHPNVHAKLHLSFWFQ
jgi:hypothetical protein